MKKFRKILAVLTTAAVSAVSLCSMFSVNAVTKLDAFKIYVNVPENSQVAFCALNISSDAYFGSNIGNLGGTIRDSLKNDSYNIYYKNSSPSNNQGTLCTLICKENSNLSVLALKNDHASIDKDTLQFRSVLLGDVNLDGVVNSDDTRMINMYFAGQISLSSAQMEAANVCNPYSSGVDESDASCIMNYVNGIAESVLG